MIELGVALIAACLPTLRPLFHDVSLESVSRSIRSKLSLHFSRSRSRSALPKDDIARRSNDSSRAFASKQSVPSVLSECDDDLDTYALASVRTTQGKDLYNARSIHVRNDLTWAVDQV